MGALTLLNEASRLAILLEDLGANADEVAESFRRLGVLGARHTVRFLNPVVRFATEEMQIEASSYAEEDETPYVLSAEITRRRTLRVQHHNGGGDKEIALPPGVTDFLDAFDAGAYPDLELPSDLF